jgi:ADP-heptose:LPS heptosyltransferase
MRTRRTGYPHRKFMSAVTSDRTGPAAASKFLIVRIDGIGDLICITPLLDALRRHFPSARIDLMANEYNADAILGNPGVDHLYIDYRTRDRLTRRRRPLLALRRIAQLLKLRRVGYDYAIAAHFGEQRRALKLVRMVRARRIIQSVEPEKVGALEDNVVNVPALWGVHEALGSFQLLKPLGIADAPGPLRIFPDPARLAVARERRREFVSAHGLRRVVGVNLSVSATTRAWPLENFVSLVERGAQRLPGTGFVLFWAGASAYGTGQSDDASAVIAIERLRNLPVLAHPTRDIQDLAAGIAVCDAVVTSDGAPLHMAAALGKPVVAFFERLEHKLVRWYPWQVPGRVLHAAPPASFEVAGITVGAAVDALSDLVTEVEHGRA